MTDAPRILQVIEPMTERIGRSDRIAHIEEDVRDAMQRADKKLRDVFTERYSITGWVADADIEAAVANRHVVARLRVTRAD